MRSPKFDSETLARDTLALTLAGGNGTRLGELTRWHCKPAIPFAGHFRNIDFTLSNCVNSQVRRIAVLTQYKAQSLIDHITRGWNFLPRALGEFVEIWPAQQRIHSAWYAGTADAIHQNLDQVLAQGRKYTLVLAGDHVYKMDYRALLARHVESGADVTVACLPVPVERAGAFGVLGVDRNGRARSFIEKPPPAALGCDRGDVLASMGVYVFDTRFLVEWLVRDAHNNASTHDFGRDILPVAVREDHVGTFQFQDSRGRPGYWRDVGTLQSYWSAHMELLASDPPIDLYDPSWPILTHAEPLPPARVLCDGRRGEVTNSMLANGTIVGAAQVSRSVLAGNVHVGDDCFIEEAVILPGARIGPRCILRRIIVDTGAIVPEGTVAGAGTTDASAGATGITLLTHGSTGPALQSVA
jgi:glucose-1-phosphate adenylyltransferase